MVSVILLFWSLEPRREIDVNPLTRQSLKKGKMTNSNRHSEIQAHGVTRVYEEEGDPMWGGDVESGPGATLSLGFLTWTREISAT